MQTTTKCDFAIAVRSHQITTSSSTMALPQSPLHQETPKQSTSHTYSSNSLALSLPLSLPSTHYCRYAALVATPLFDAPKTLTSKTKAAASLVLSLVLFLSHTHRFTAMELENLAGDDGNWWTVFLLFQVFGPAASMAGGRGPPSLVRGRYHTPRSSAARSTLWGEPAQGNSANRLTGNSSGNNENLGGSIVSRSHRRRSRERGRGHGL